MTIIRELVLHLDKVIFVLKYSVKLCRYILCCDVTACHRAACVLCAVQNETVSTGLSLIMHSLTNSAFVGV